LPLGNHPRDFADLDSALGALENEVERHITRDRVRRYLEALIDTPAPSTLAAALRVPVLRRLLHQDGAFGDGRLHFHADFGRTGSPVILTGSPEPAKPLWYFAHLDTISYLLQPFDGERYPLVPFCSHQMQDGVCRARAYRYEVHRNSVTVIAEGRLESQGGKPFFRSDAPAVHLQQGDRVSPFALFREGRDGGSFTGQMDNAGGVAALAVAALVLARTGAESLVAFPDEEEGPVAAGNQTIGRGATRLVNLLSAPDLAVVADVQQGGGDHDADVRDGVENSTRLGGGAVLAEFSSLGRGAVTPPDLYALARHMAHQLARYGVKIQESNNAYSSRSDDVSVMLRTPNILQLGFPGFNRHFDRGAPRAHLDDVVHLAKSLVYMSTLWPLFVKRRRALLGEAS
jgi:Peptidase family M20/M25/M40